MLPAAHAANRSSSTTSIIGTTPAPISTLPSSKQIETKIAEVQASTSIDDETRKTLLELYRRALSNLEDKKNFDAKAASYANALKTAPNDTQSIQKELEKLGKQPDDGVDLPDSLSADDITQRLNKVLADRAIAETRLGELDKLISSTSDRPNQARTRITEVKQELDQIDTDQTTAQSETPDLTQARGWAMETKRQSLFSEGRMLEQELLSQSVRETLYKAQRELTAQKLRLLNDQQHALETLQSQRRTEEAAAAQRASEQAQKEAQNQHPLVQQLARENAQLTSHLSRLANELDDYDDEMSALSDERKRVEEDFQGSRQRIEAAGLSKALGQVLIERRSQLPDLRQYRKAIDQREDAISDASLNEIRYEEERRKLVDQNGYIEELTASDPTAQTPEVREQLVKMIRQRQQLLDQVLSSEDDYVRKLGDLNYAAEQLIEVANRYDHFLAERLLWVRNAPAVDKDMLLAIPHAFSWLVSYSGWKEILRAWTERMHHAPLFWIGYLLAAFLFWKNSSLRRRIRATADPLRRVRTDSIHHTLRAIFLTFLCAAPLPLAFWVLGQQLQSSPETTAYSRSFGIAFSEVSFGLYYLLVFRTLCISGGVADRHFRWSIDVISRVRRNFDWFALCLVPLSLVTITLYNFNNPANANSLGRLSLVAAMICLAVIFWNLLHPSTGVLKQTLENRPNSWPTRLRYLWFGLIQGIPVLLALLALIGYVYTAGTLFQSLVSQTWIILALLVIHQVIVRWLMVARRRLALQAALDRQAARRAQAEAGGAEPVPTEVLPIEEAEPNLAALDEQTRRLINAVIIFAAIVGLWLTWSDILPALTMLEKFALWHHTAEVNGTQQQVPVTAADLGLALVIAFVATIAAKNLPALIEILLLESESVSAGARYAIKSMASYIITVTAFLMIFSTLGLNWSQVQWLVAALSVGIGFGLQEIVANFISGLIILFERPVRVGDIVTIGDTTGVVTNIEIRATTIRNWDKQELLVPNKEFITGRLLNWTLTDQQNRVTINVGVAYGSDVRLALSLLSEVTTEHELVLRDPAPLISFEGFGDNTLNLVLRCYLNSLDGRIGVVSDLHQAINDKFAEHGISIAFPQRDVHLDTLKPLEVRVQPVEPRDPRSIRTLRRKRPI